MEDRDSLVIDVRWKRVLPDCTNSLYKSYTIELNKFVETIPKVLPLPAKLIKVSDLWSPPPCPTPPCRFSSSFSRGEIDARRINCTMTNTWQSPNRVSQTAVLTPCTNPGIASILGTSARNEFFSGHLVSKSD